ncbi:MAG: SDR family oxidoreductase [Sphingomonadaceae bacterium]|uniref:SDR family NAD(P)-dependent oxidoreductase n=1 Tax=Thermaurantiacus sp. TaxID=2820283 RepID=UPI00298F0682|nr:SDR family NAD(P)-dependent oxidoreductase [Thermaurantiacus sp.]MCS6986766.1 SDR family oxidoreductase [Sphingomonadaceae bacterium]MDW8413971.1 SDR family NAD(P)-dependent oxidoreductase [Thermaurantiacus sp.]
MADPRSIEGFVALVTGAASGIGAATARVLAAAGAHVAVTDVNETGARQVAAGIEAEGGSAQGFRLDVADTQGVEDAVHAVARWHGRLDILVNNAGIAGFAPVDDPGYPALLERMLQVNLVGQVRTIRAALVHLRAAPHPRIVNIASTEALGATARDSAYCAAKAGVVGLTRALAVELGPEGITVNCICPGPILTPMTAGIPATDRETYARRRTALRRYGQPEEVAHLVLSLVLPAAAYLTGAVIPVDGGLMARNA